MFMVSLQASRDAKIPLDSYSLNSLKGLHRDCIGEYSRIIKGDTRSLDYSSCVSSPFRIESSTFFSL